MSAILETSIQESKLKIFQKNCDLFSKQCSVLLGFVVPLSTFATHIVLSLLIIAWFLAGNLKEKIHIIVNHPVAKLALLLFGVFIVGALYSEACRIDSMAMLEKMSKLLYIPFLLPVMKEEKWRRFAFFAFLSAMLLTLGLSILKIYGNKLHVFTNMRLNPAAVFKDTLFTNLMMAFASFMSGHFLLNQSKLSIRISLAIFSVCLVIYVLLIGSGRSGYAVFSILCLLFGFQRWKLKGLGIAIFGLILLLGFAYFNSDVFKDRLSLVKQNIEQYTAGDTETSVGLRLVFLSQTWKLSKQRLWFGHGTGSFKEIYQNHAAVHHLTPTQNPHNEYVNILFQTGLFGLSVFISFFFFLFKWSSALPSLERWFAQGIILTMVIGCFANSWLMDFTSGYLFVMMVAFCFGALKLKKGLTA